MHTIQDAQNISIKKVSSHSRSDIFMENKKHSYKILEKADAINTNEGQCVIDYIIIYWNE